MTKKKDNLREQKRKVTLAWAEYQAALKKLYSLNEQEAANLQADLESPELR